MFGGVSLVGKRAVLFDIDGTLLDTTGQLVAGLGDTFEHFLGMRPSAEAILATVGMPLREQMKLYRSQAPTEAEIATMVDYTIERYQIHKHHVRVFEPAVEALKLFKTSGFKTAVVTSRNHTELEHFFTDFSAVDAINAAVCVSDVVFPKPHGESALLACERLGVSPAESVYIGDSIFDVKCAQDAQVAMIAVTYGMGKETALRAENPDMIISSPDELLRWAREAIEPLCAAERN
ncbi:MAG: HAD-IA family hydrolase [Fimbriimonadaceae bacterium]